MKKKLLLYGCVISLILLKPATEILWMENAKAGAWAEKAGSGSLKTAPKR
jgi:hypothetical protein